jgi:hypothetical protein
MIFRMAALKAKNGITSVQALRQAGAIEGYFPAHFSSKASSWRAASSAAGASQIGRRSAVRGGSENDPGDRFPAG